MMRHFCGVDTKGFRITKDIIRQGQATEGGVTEGDLEA
jgi:hypothetical protein